MRTGAGRTPAGGPPRSAAPRPAQPGPAPAAADRLVNHHPVQHLDLPQRPARVLTTGFPTGPVRRDFGAGLPNPSADGGVEEFREDCLTRACNSAT